MRGTILIAVFIILQSSLLTAQTITGKLVDQFGIGLSDLQLKLYISPKVYAANSQADGSFTFANITSVEKEILPSGYSVSQNYPNPFNPKTRIDFSFPERSSVKVKIYNSIGQCVKSLEEMSYLSGTSHMDLELNGLSNGMYIAQMVINHKYTVTKKLMLLYGSQHLITVPISSQNEISKTTETINLDSLVVNGANVYKTTFSSLPQYQGSTLTLGTFKIPHPCPGTQTVTYASQVYNTVQIGSQCWLKENLNVGDMILVTQSQSYNNKIEKYCYNNDVANCTKYGGLYLWEEAMQYVKTEKTQGICPTGWHIPSKAELHDTLNSFVKGWGNKLKREDQGLGVVGKGTNESNFSALLAGYRSPDYGGRSYHLGAYTYFWSSTQKELDYFYFISLNYTNNAIDLSIYYTTSGFSIRCLKDN